MPGGFLEGVGGVVTSASVRRARSAFLSLSSGRIDEIDGRQVPARDTQLHARERPVGGGDLEAHPLHGDGTVALALLARDLHAEGPPEGLGAGAVAADVGAFEVALKRRLAELTVDRAVVLLLDPRLGGPVEQLQGEHRLALEHGHEAVLDPGPEVLLLGVLLGAVGQGRVVQDAEPLQPLDHLGGGHRAAAVTDRGAWHLALLDPLAEAVDQILGVLLVLVPLRVGAHARAVVEDAEQMGGLELSGGGDHLPPALVEVVVPERVDVRELVGACLTRHHFRGLAALAPPTARATLAHQAMVLQEAAHRRVAHHRTERGVLLHQDGEVVAVELVAPPRMVPVLLRERRRESRRHARMRPRVLGHLALERADRIGLVPRQVVHPLDRLVREVDRLARRRMLPRLARQLADAALELALLRG
jgi:hypothetical protein